MIRQLLILLLTGSLYGALPTGTLTTTTPSPNCQSGFTCTDYVVQCPNVIDKHPTRGALGRWQSVNPVGTVLIFSGHEGGAWWNTTTLSQAWLQRMHDSHYDLVEVRWYDNGWSQAWGYPQGFSSLACREATVIKWVHDNYLVNGPYIAMGGSEGSAGIGYSLSRYGVADFVDQAVLVSGPPMADLAIGCTDSDPAWAYVQGAETWLVDQPWAWQACADHDRSKIPDWISNSVETGGNDYCYPDTAIAFIVGGQDAANIRNHAFTFYTVLNNNGQPNLSWTLVQRMPHSIQQSQDGLNVLFNTITQ